MDKRATYARTAPLYDLLDLPFERGRYRHLRPVLWAGVGGTVLDAGVGTGRNMPFYPPDAKVTGIDFSPQMLARARKRRERLGADVELREMDIRKTDFPDAHFDFVVATFLFCVLDQDDQAPALGELRRICKPDGEVRLLEYVYSARPAKRFVMDLWAPWVRFLYGAAFDRDTERHVGPMGWELVESRFLFEDIIKLLVLRPIGHAAGGEPVG